MGEVLLRIFSGTGAGQIRAVSGNNPDTITVTRAWTTNPDATSWFVVERRDASDYGDVDSATASTLKAEDRNWTLDHWKDTACVSITSGPGEGERRKITGNTADTLTVEKKWTVQPPGASTYSIEYQPPKGSFEIKAEEN
jgi:hypothetical protein